MGIIIIQMLLQKYSYNLLELQRDTETAMYSMESFYSPFCCPVLGHGTNLKEKHEKRNRQDKLQHDHGNNLIILD